jgi:hypothetical protein
MLRLDSAGQKGPEIVLESILIAVEGCFTAENMLDQNTVSPMAPVFLHISRKLPNVLLAEQHGAYSLLPQMRIALQSIN